MSDRLGRIDLAQRTANGGTQTARILRAAHDQHRLAVRCLRDRHVILRQRIIIQTAMPHVSDNADDRRPFFLHHRRANIDSFPNGVFVRPITFRQSGVDDCNRRCIRIVRFAELPAPQQ